MKQRNTGFLSETNIDHSSEIFDYIHELHEYLWEVVNMVNPGASGFLKDLLDPAIKELKSNFHWISVSERLPENGKTVLLFDGACKYIGWLSNDEFRTYGAGLYGITHWMPLPDAPEVEK